MPVSDNIALAKPEDVGFSRERLGRLTDVLERDIEAGLIPGCVVLVARRGRVVLFKALGRLGPGEGAAPMERDSVFRLYSMTKPVVSVAAMMLAEEGRLAVGDPVSRYLPEYADLTVGPDRTPAARVVRVQDLLRHTSGLTYEWMDDGPVHRLYAEARVGRRSYTNAEQAAALARLPLVAEPGTEFQYSHSTDVLGRVVEVVSGQTLGRHLRERVFEPLGMLETGFRVPPEFASRLAEPFDPDPETGEAVRLLDVRAEVASESGGGGLCGTAPDYNRFLHMLSAGGTLDGVRLLGPRTIAYMTADHLGPAIRIAGDLLPEGYGFGLGFAVRRGDGIAPFAGTAGDYYWEGLAGTSFWVDPGQELYGLTMVQAPGRREHYRRLTRQMVYGAIVE